MSGLARDRIQKISEDPLADLATGACRQVHEADAILSRWTGPGDLAVGFHAQAWKSQLKAQADALLLVQRPNRLHCHPLVIEVANDSTVALVERDIGQRAQFMPVLGAWLPRGKRYCFHTLRQE